MKQVSFFFFFLSNVILVSKNCFFSLDTSQMPGADRMPSLRTVQSPISDVQRSLLNLLEVGKSIPQTHRCCSPRTGSAQNIIIFAELLSLWQ